MTVSLWIPTAWQFGELAAGEARQGAMQQAVSQAIKRHLFEETETESGEDSAYDRALLAFMAMLREPLSPKTRPSARDLWSALLPAEALTDPTSLTTDAKQQVPEPIEVAFCWAMHGLCSALALRWVGTDDDPDEEDVEPGEAVPDPSSQASTYFKIEHHEAVTVIARLVRLATGHRNSSDTTTKAEDVRLVSAILLDSLLAVCGDGFAVVAGETLNRGGKAHTPKWIEVRSPTLVQRIASLLAELPFRFTLQPLKQPAAYRLEDPGPSATDEGDYFHVHLIGYRRDNGFLRDLHDGFQRAEHRAPAFDRYVEAINLQQAVPWRINRPLLNWVRQLCTLAHDPDSAEAAYPGLREWVLEKFYQPSKEGARKTIERPVEFLVNPLALRALEELCPAEGALPTFYLPWKADYRGRIYAETPWLTPQGGDIQRAEFFPMRT